MKNGIRGHKIETVKNILSRPVLGRDLDCIAELIVDALHDHPLPLAPPPMTIEPLIIEHAIEHASIPFKWRSLQNHLAMAHKQNSLVRFARDIDGMKDSLVIEAGTNIGNSGVYGETWNINYFQEMFTRAADDYETVQQVFALAEKLYANVSPNRSST